jgi:hypothetical protein
MIHSAALRILVFLFSIQLILVNATEKVADHIADDIDQACENVDGSIDCDSCAVYKSELERFACRHGNFEKKKRRLIVPEQLQGYFSKRHRYCNDNQAIFDSNVGIGSDSISWGVVVSCDITKKTRSWYRLACREESVEETWKNSVRIRKTKSGVVVNGVKYVRCPE